MAAVSPDPEDNSATPTLSLKLLVDTKADRVLYAEAGKDVVDFLFSFLALPIGTAVKLLGKESMAGCVGNVYASVESLDDTYVEPGAAKDALLRPTVPSAAISTKSSSLFFLPAPPTPVDQQPLPKRFFRCSGMYYSYGYGESSSSSCEGDYLTDTCDTQCPSCSGYLNKEMTFLPAAVSRQSSEAKATGNENGLVRSVVTYTVMNDLKVAPMSTIAGITLLISTFGIIDISVIKETTIQIGYDEGLEILRLSLRSKTVLTDVFLGKKKVIRSCEDNSEQPEGEPEGTKDKSERPVGQPEGTNEKTGKVERASRSSSTDEDGPLNVDGPQDVGRPKRQVKPNKKYTGPSWQGQ